MHDEEKKAEAEAPVQKTMIAVTHNANKQRFEWQVCER